MRGDLGWAAIWTQWMMGSYPAFYPTYLRMKKLYLIYERDNCRIGWQIRIFWTWPVARDNRWLRSSSALRRNCFISISFSKTMTDFECGLVDRQGIFAQWGLGIACGRRKSGLALDGHQNISSYPWTFGLSMISPTRYSILGTNFKMVFVDARERLINQGSFWVEEQVKAEWKFSCSVDWDSV